MLSSLLSRIVRESVASRAHQYRHRPAARATAAAEALERRALLAVTVLNVDPSQSSLTLSGDALGNPFVAQDAPAMTSLVTSFFGTLNADVTATSIAFALGDDAVTANNSGSWVPDSTEAQNANVPEPANYGVRFAGVAVGAFRAMVLDVRSGEPIPVAADGSFAVGTTSIDFSQGRIDYNIPGFGVGPTDVGSGDAPATNAAPAAGSFTVDEGVARLVLPVNVTFFLEANEPNDVRINFTGQIVATGTVPASTVVNRHVFYNNSFFDGNNVAANAADDGAIAPKSALFPGQAATFNNVISFTKGINGIMIDLNGAFEAGEITADDFGLRVGSGGNPADYTPAPAPTAVAARPLTDGSGFTRVTITWADGAILKQWLQVTVLTGTDTGLASQDVFYFGNLPGEVGDNDALFVNAVDVQRTRLNQFETADINSPYDHNRNGGIVNAQDLQLSRINQFSSITPFTPPQPALFGSEDDEGEDA